jgi:hypothetical protein
MQDSDVNFSKSLKALKELSRRELQAGLLDNGKKNKNNTLISDYAYKNEYGTSSIPARSFMRSTVREQEISWQREIDHIIEKVLKAPEASIKDAVEKLGERMVSDIRAKIESNIPPPNSKETIKRKKSNKTLIDTGMLRNAIDYKYV